MKLDGSSLTDHEAHRLLRKWKEAIEYIPSNPELNQIILQWLEKHPSTKRIYF